MVSLSTSPSEYTLDFCYCQPTSERFMKAGHLLGMKQIFISFNNSKGNVDTERLMRAIKEDVNHVIDSGINHLEQKGEL